MNSICLTYPQLHLVPKFEIATGSCHPALLSFNFHIEVFFPSKCEDKATLIRSSRCTYALSHCTLRFSFMISFDRWKLKAISSTSNNKCSIPRTKDLSRCHPSLARPPPANCSSSIRRNHKPCDPSCVEGNKSYSVPLCFWSGIIFLPDQTRFSCYVSIHI